MSSFSYEISAGYLKRMGFSTIQQLEDCIASADGDEISRVLWGSRQGQITRFEAMLLAQMGETYALRHPWGVNDFWAEHFPKQLQRLRDGGITIGTYDPSITQN